MVKGKAVQSIMRHTGEDRIYFIIVNIVIWLLLLIVVYPVIFILSASFSSPFAVSSGQVFLFPVEPSLEGYRAVFRDPRIIIGYRNTIFYTVVGTLINVFMTMICAYPLARKGLPHRKPIMFFITFIGNN